MDGALTPGSTPALVSLVDRILRLAQHDQVALAMTSMDREQLQWRASEASQTLQLCETGHAAVAAVPALCSLAVECINVVERAELSTVLARLVTAGCEVLATLLLPLAEAEVPSSFDWVRETLEDLSDQIDFLALEVYCGLGRLETKFLESDELPVVLDPIEDDFGAYWGSIEHRQALQELSAWLLCVLFRALGYASVTAGALMEFVNHDLLCLCSLLRGLLAVRPDASLPHDTAHLQGVALAAFCGLAAPDLAFRHGGEGDSDIHQQNRSLEAYLEVLGAAMVETGVLESAVDASLARSVALPKEGAASGFKLFQFLSSLLAQAALESDSPLLKLRADVHRLADKLGRLLEAVVAHGFHSLALRELLSSCAVISGSLVLHSGMPEGCSDDHFTLSCRLLLNQCCESMELLQGDGAAVAALGALACNVGDLEYFATGLVEKLRELSPEELLRARARLARRDRQGLVLTAAGETLLQLFGTEQLPAAPKEAPEVPKTKPGLRDLVQNAPQELRCAVDQKLLCDPVVSPGGVIFERSTLARWLQKHGNTCPVTGEALRLEDCSRSPELRKKVTEWVRAARGRK